MKIPFLLMFVSSTVLANDDGLLRCHGIADPSMRLACYDALPVQQKSGTSQHGSTQTSEQFGLEDQAYKAELPAINSYIRGHFEGWKQKTKIRLANGQVWQISDDSTAIYDLDNPKISIRRGMLGTFFLDIEGYNNSPRVKRLQ